MLSLLFNLKGLAAVGGAALLIGFGSGVWVRDAFCDAASSKAQVAALNNTVRIERNSRLVAEAAENEQRVMAAAAELARITTEKKSQEIENALRAAPSHRTRVCIDRGIARRLREL